jgi:hypothetical protein
MHVCLQACLKFLRERTLDEVRVEGQVGAGVTGQRPGPIISLSLDTVNAFFKVIFQFTTISTTEPYNIINCVGFGGNIYVFLCCCFCIWH